jgi:PadR family transcriptional regulator AphA
MTELSVTEYAVLGILAEGPNHGFALARELTPRADLGRIYTVRRPLVYRALDRLVEAGLAEAMHIEESEAGPNRIVVRATRQGRATLRRWLGKPVGHVRDIRIEFLLKLALLQRSGGSPGSLIDRQREALQPTLGVLEEISTDDHVEIWRRHNARATDAYLEELRHLYV